MKKQLSLSIMIVCLLSACGKVKPTEVKEIETEQKMDVNEKFIPYFSIEKGKYKLDLNLEEALKIGIDSIYYQPVRDIVDTLNFWIEKYHIAPEQVMNGETVAVLTDEGDSLYISLIGTSQLSSLLQSVKK